MLNMLSLYSYFTAPYRKTISFIGRLGKISRIIGLFSLLAMLTACAPAAFVAGVATGGAVGADKRTLQAISHDQRIKQHIQGAWKQDLMLEHAHITATSFNRVVLLVGQVTTEQARQRAYQLASNAPHAHRLYNRIEVCRVTSMVTRSKDAWITAKIKSLLLAKEGMPSVHIKVITEKGVVYLMGILKPTEGQQAARIARRVSGVKKVVKLFEYDRNLF